MNTNKTMNINLALNIMNINKKDLYLLDNTKLKKIYHTRALTLHPDKGGTNEEFKLLSEAYDYLNIMVELNEYNTSPYENYVKSCSDNFEYSNVVNKMKTYVFKYINSISESFINECDDTQLGNIEQILEYYKDKIPQSVYNKISSVMKTNNCKEFILNPSLNDLFENKIYRFNYNNEIFNVPLWHSELYYNTKDNNEICIKCLPDLSPFIDIDTDNNINIYVFENINTIFKNQYLEVKLNENKVYRVNADEINFVPCQIIILKNKGISKIYGNNIYDTNKKSNIIVTLNMTL